MSVAARINGNKTANAHSTSRLLHCLLPLSQVTRSPFGVRTLHTPRVLPYTAGNADVDANDDTGNGEEAGGWPPSRRVRRRDVCGGI